MANDKTVWEEILAALVGALGTVGVGELVKFAKNRVQAAAIKKADDLLDDHGSRTAILTDVATLMKSPDEKTAKAGNQVREWFIQAERDHLEGEITDLFRKFPENKADDRRLVFEVLGGLDSYDAFIATVTTFLKHDNLFQLMLKAAENAKKAGGSLFGEDVRKIQELAKGLLKGIGNSANDAAGVLLPHVQNLNNFLRRLV